MKSDDGAEQTPGSKESDKEDMEVLRDELRSFSSAISHDLHAPVRRIIGLSQIIVEDHAEGLDDMGRKYLDIIASEGVRMDVMIQDLLTWSRAAVCECNMREVDLSKVVNAIISEEKNKENAPEIEATIDDHVIVKADPDLIEMVMRELIDNSLKFAHKGTIRKIEFGKERTESGVILFLKDNGVGFDQSRSHRMFDPFKRLHGNEFPGEGMGLAIARLIVKRHGGKIWAESAPEKGSTFFISLDR